MAKVHGVAGEWARVKGTVWGLWPLFLGMFVLGLSVALMLAWSVLWGGLLFVASLVFVGWSVGRGLRHVERYFKGARGEEKVSGILQGLPDAYHVYNDFVAKGCHIDHVVVGPAGVFAVETKFWRGTVTVERGDILLNGDLPDRSPLFQVIREANLVKAELQRQGWSGDVTPVLVFASDTFEAKIAEIQGAVVLNANHLRASFDTDRVVIFPAELERLTRMMELNG